MTHTSMYRMTGLATVATFLAEMGTEIAEKMTAWLRDVLEPGETMPDVAFLMTLIRRKIEQARERLRAKDGRLNRAVTAFHKALRVRDKAAEKMRGVLIHARELLDGCTPESAAPAKFRGRISQRWLTAWRQADGFRNLLLDPGFRPEPRPGLLPYPKAELEPPEEEGGAGVVPGIRPGNGFAAGLLPGIQTGEHFAARPLGRFRPGEHFAAGHLCKIRPAEHFAEDPTPSGRESASRAACTRRDDRGTTPGHACYAAGDRGNAGRRTPEHCDGTP